MTTEPTTLREALEAAIPAEEPAAAPSSEPSTPSTPAPAETSTPAPAAEVKTDTTRNERGQFAPKAAAEKAPGDPAAPAAPAAARPEITPGPKAEPPRQPQDRPPASWRPEVREHWSTMPAEAKAEIVRREREHQQLLQETAEGRKTLDALDRVVRPYEMFIRAENSNPLQAIDNLMSTAARLRTAPAQDVAQLVAGVVKQFGVGRFGQQFIEQLDAALVGEIPRENPQEASLQRAIASQLAPVQQFMSQFQQVRQQQEQQAVQQAAAEVEQFLERAEFGADVREDMADLMEVAAKRGRELSLAEAYRQACIAHPEVSKILATRHGKGAAPAAPGAAQRARAAAVSVTGSPAMGVPSGGAADVRSAIEAALAAHSR